MITAQQVVDGARRVIKEQEWQILRLEAEVDRLHEVIVDLRKRLEENNG